MVTNTEDLNIWRRRYVALCEKITASIGDTRWLEKLALSSPEPVLDSMPVLYISNDMDVTDNRAYAIEHFGEGRFRAYHLASETDPLAQKIVNLRVALSYAVDGAREALGEAKPRGFVESWRRGIEIIAGEDIPFPRPEEES